MNRFVCIHGHFYQPPRENPWLEEVELQDSAYPYHDWNEKVTAECYAPNAASRILDPERVIIDIVNNYSKVSFNFGPTLATWMQKHNAEAYQAILDADKKSQKLFSGHGSALAQCYNHMIMPLANKQDKRTQVIWGLRDFEYRFGRKPEGMWLPEAAVDLETLDMLAENGIKFTVLSPGQAKQVRKIGEEKWQDVNGAKFYPRKPYICILPSKKTIAIFFYDGSISQEIAFGGLLDNGENFAKRLTTAFSQNNESPQLVHIATDGETYGHHHRFGDMALAYCLYYLEANNLAKLTNYGEYLEKNPPQHEAEIFENSSWSCFHGIERWRNDCGCNSGMHQGWNQKWRAPLRGALDWLRDNLIQIYQEQASKLLKQPWEARNDYINVILDRSTDNIEKFLNAHKAKELSGEDKVKTLKLLEMQRHAMLIYTSCGWFFDEISGVETVQVLQYAARAMQLAKETSGVSLEEAFINLLERAPSNIAEFDNGAKVYELFVRPAVLDLLRVGVHYAVSSLFKEHVEETEIYSYFAKSKSYETLETGKQKLNIGRVIVRSKVTREENEVSFTVLHLGDHNLIAAAREFMGEEAFLKMQQELKKAFDKGDIAEITREIEKHFNHESYSLWHLFRDEQRKVLNQIFDSAINEINNSFRQIFEHHAGILQVTDKLKMPLPKPFASVAEFVLNMNIRESLEQEAVNIQKLKKSVEDIKRFSLSIDKPTISFIISNKINMVMEQISKDPEDLSRFESAVELLKIITALPLDLNLWKAQNIYFSIGKQMRPKAEQHDELATRWLTGFNSLGGYLKVRVT